MSRQTSSNKRKHPKNRKSTRNLRTIAGDSAHHGAGWVGSRKSSSVSVKVPRKLVVSFTACFYELVGAFFFHMIGRGAVSLISETSVLNAAIVNGVTLAFLTLTLGSCSGGDYNWAVTFYRAVAFMFSRNRKTKSMRTNFWAKFLSAVLYVVTYCISQFVGSLIGAYFLEGILSFGDSEGLGTPTLLLARSLGYSFALEAFMSWVFIYVNLHLIGHHSHLTKALVIGATYGGILSFILPLNLGALNPLIFITYGIVSGNGFHQSWVYICAPFVGGLAALFHYVAQVWILGPSSKREAYVGWVPYLRNKKDFENEIMNDEEVDVLNI